MSALPAAGLDRRHRRREETIGQIVDVAVALMGEQGAAGLSLGEVARRMEIRTPSLYGYFDSKNALYDAIFERGWRELLQAMEPILTDLDADSGLANCLLPFAAGFARWAVEHPAYSQLLFWRSVPGYQPSPAAYSPAVKVFEQGLNVFHALHERGALRADTNAAEAFRAWTVLISGVVSQQLANGPDEPFESGTFTSGIPQLVAMFAMFYGPGRQPGPKGRRTHAGAHQRNR